MNFWALPNIPFEILSIILFNILFNSEAAQHPCQSHFQCTSLLTSFSIFSATRVQGLHQVEGKSLKGRSDTPRGIRCQLCVETSRPTVLSRGVSSLQ